MSEDTANDTERTERERSCPAPYGWALSTVMRKNNGATQSSRPMLGAYYDCSEFEAVGQFADSCLEENKGFDMGQIIRLPLRSPNTEISGMRAD